MQPSPKLAKASGDKYYFTGKPCLHGHITQRFVSTHACIDCLAAAKKAYRAAPANRAKEAAYRDGYIRENAELLKAKRLAKYETDPAPFLTASREWKLRNRDRVSAYCSEYKRARPGENAARAAKYNATKRAATPSWADMDAIKRVYLAAEDLTKETGIPHEVDHIHPLNGRKSCGLHVDYNLRAIPAKLNRAKYNKLPDEVSVD